MAPGIGLSAAQLLDLVDAGEPADAAARGRLMLAAAVADAPDELTLGQRDAWVLELRCGTYGDTLASRVRCPDCGLTLSVKIPYAHVGVAPLTVEVAADVVTVRSGPWVVEARPVDCVALAVAARCRDVASARVSLISSCVVRALHDGEAVDPLAIDDDALLESVGDAILAADPGCEIRVPLACAGCGLQWSPVLDIVHFLWRELTSSSAHLLDEIHALAKGYGWTEDHVLVLSSRRRRQYVERLAGA